MTPYLDGTRAYTRDPTRRLTLSRKSSFELDHEDWSADTSFILVTKEVFRTDLPNADAVSEVADDDPATSQGMTKSPAEHAAEEQRRRDDLPNAADKTIGPEREEASGKVNRKPSPADTDQSAETTTDMTSNTSDDGAGHRSRGVSGDEKEFVGHSDENKGNSRSPPVGTQGPPRYAVGLA